MNSIADTIAAVATAPGHAGIAVVRVSGPQSLSIADRIFLCPSPPPSSHPPLAVCLGQAVDRRHGQERVIDEALLILFKAPRSYTGEDTVEIQCHGSPAVASAILQSAFQAGARPAEPGEFTKRAFLNGRIDLLQAEAVSDLIYATTDRAVMAAMDQLSGRLTSYILDCYNDISEALAALEASLDFPEEDLPASLLDKAPELLATASSKLGCLLSTFRQGRILRHGALVVISGKPNVGKSTLLNALLQQDRAIVSPMPGTTRDTIEEQTILDGFPLRLVDTAGIYDVDSVIEKEAISRAFTCIRNADINLHLLDSSSAEPATEKDLPPDIKPGNTILVLNKTDLGQAITPQAFPSFTCVQTSLVRNTGLDSLKQELRANLFQTPLVHGACISERHYLILQQALACINTSVKTFSQTDQLTHAITATELRSALQQLDMLTGKDFSNSLLDNIFQTFCIGK